MGVPNPVSYDRTPSHSTLSSTRKNLEKDEGKKRKNSVVYPNAMICDISYAIPSSFPKKHSMTRPEINNTVHPSGPIRSSKFHKLHPVLRSRLGLGERWRSYLHFLCVQYMRGCVLKGIELFVFLSFVFHHHQDIKRVDVIVQFVRVYI